MKINHYLNLLLVALITMACSTDNDPTDHVTKGLSDNILTWGYADGRQLAAEYHEDLAFVVMKGEDYWNFKEKIDKRGIATVLPYSYYQGEFGNTTPEQFANAVKVVLDTDFKEVKDMEEVLYAGPCVKGIKWVGGAILHLNEKGDTINYVKLEDLESSPYADEFANNYYTNLVTPIFNYITGMCDADKQEQFMDFVKENNLILGNHNSIYTTKDSKYDVLTLTNLLNQRFGKFSFFTTSSPLDDIHPAIDGFSGPAIQKWWSRGYTEPIFGRYLSVTMISEGQYRLKEGKTLIFNQNGKGSLREVLDDNGNSCLMQWENEYVEYYDNHMNDTGHEINPAEFYGFKE